MIESKQSGAFKRTNTDLMHLIEKCENGDRFAAFRMSRIACSMKTLFDFFFGMRKERSSGWYHSWVVRYFNSKRKAYGTDSDSSLCMGLNPGVGVQNETETAVAGLKPFGGPEMSTQRIFLRNSLIESGATITTTPWRCCASCLSRNCVCDCWTSSLLLACSRWWSMTNWARSQLRRSNYC